MSEYCKNCFELAEKLTKKERECNTLKSQLDFAVRQKERFEQQCEALKSEGFTRESLITEQENEIDELKHENEELKEKLKREIKNTVDMERLAKSYGQDMLTYRQEKQIEIEELQTNIDRYRKALEEIEQIVNEPCVADAQEDCKHCDFWCEHKEILDIINKAKGEGNVAKIF